MDEKDLELAINDFFNEEFSEDSFRRYLDMPSNRHRCLHFLKNRLIESKRIKDWRYSITVKQNRVKEEFDKANNDIKKEIANMQSHCKHSRQTYHSDPAGGSDSYYECDLCGQIR